MTGEETFLLTEYVRACCPQQAMGEYTPDAWHDLLGDLELGDCRAAVAAVAKRQPFVAPAEIRVEVRRIRDARIAAALLPPPPPELADDEVRYRAALAADIKLAADGHAPPAPATRAITAGPADLSAQRRGAPPASLRSALADLRKELGPARARGHLADPRAVAAEQAEEARRLRREQEEAS